MSEFYTEALVLDIEDAGAANSFIHLYTQKLGRIKAKAVGIKKITSKLAGHFQPLNFVNARIVDGGNFILADGLSISGDIRHRTADFISSALKAASLIKKATPECETDLVAWHFIKEIFISGDANKAGNIKMLLKALGFEPQTEKCEFCRINHASFFSFVDANFICEKCIENLNLPENDIQLI